MRVYAVGGVDGAAALGLDLDQVRSRVEQGETVLRGESLDQAALHGVLERVRELGLELLEVRRLPTNSHP